MRISGHVALILFSFYLHIIIAKLQNRAQVLTSFNFLRNRELYFTHDAMCT